MKHFYSLLPATLFAGFAGILSTSSLATDSTSIEYVADDVIEITSTRLPQTVGQSITPITIIDKDTIQENGYSSAADVVNSISGIQINYTGGNKQLTSIISRGTSSRHTLVMLDGLPINQVQSGSTRLEHIPVASIERIEVIKGSQANAYGSETMGSIINIITLKKSGIGVSIQGGTEGTFNSELRLADSIKNGFLQLALGQQFTDGINSLQNADPDEDGYKQNYVRLNLDKTLTNELELFASGNVSKGEAKYDGYTDEYTFSTHQAQIGLNHKTARSQSTLRVYEQNEKTRNFGGTYSGITEQQPNRFYAQRTGAQFTAQIEPVQNYRILFGVDYNEDDINGTKVNVDTYLPPDFFTFARSYNGYNADKRINRGAFTSLTANFDNITGEIGIRYDHNNQYGEHTNYNIGLSTLINDTTEVFSRYSTASKAPTFDALYYPGYSNPNLELEESEQSELGFNTEAGDFNITMTGYYNEFSNLIKNGSQPENIADAVVKGTEIDINYKKSKSSWSHNIAYSYTDAEDKDTSKQLSRTAYNQLSTQSSYRYSPKLSFVIKSQSRSKSFSPAGKEHPGFVVWGVGANYLISSQLTLNATIDNLLNKAYYTNEQFGSFYNEAPRTVLLSLTYQQ